MSAPLVSIVIPCYNAAPWLESTLESVRAQSWKHHETILVDDGSTDGSLEIARKFSGITLKVLSQPNAGPSAALNHALRYAQGDYVEFLDADDLIHPDKLSIQLQRTSTIPERTILSGEWARFNRHPGETPFVAEPVWRDLSSQDWLITSWLGGGMMPGAAWLIPACLVREAGPWCEDLRLVNDFEYFTRVLLCAEQVLFCPGARTYYRSGLPGSISTSRGASAWLSAFNAYTRGTEQLLHRNRSPRAMLASATILQRFAYSAWPEAPDLVQRAESLVALYGGCDVPLRSGFLFNCIARTFGWKAARRLQHSLHQARKAGKRTDKT